MATWPMVQVRYIPRFGLYAIYTASGLWRAKRNKNQNATLRALPRNIATWIPQHYAVGVTTSSDSDPLILRDRGNAVCSDPVILRGSFTRKCACALVRAVRRWRAFIGTE